MVLSEYTSDGREENCFSYSPTKELLFDTPEKLFGKAALK